MDRLLERMKNLLYLMRGAASGSPSRSAFISIWPINPLLGLKPCRSDYIDSLMFHNDLIRRTLFLHNDPFRASKIARLNLYIQERELTALLHEPTNNPSAITITEKSIQRYKDRIALFPAD